jgi:mannose-6-phosphate isomerase-like protein (cupin superfamily)
MFAIPEHAVLEPVSHHPLSPATLVWSVSSDAPRWRELLSRADVADQLGPVAVPLPWDDPRVSIWLSVLPPSHPGSLRGYDAQQGAFAVLAGHVVEQTGGRTRALRPGQVRVFGPGYRHLVRNGGAEPAVSVHVQIRPAPLG